MADFPAAAATYVTPDERAALGRGARKGSPRSRHGDWQPSSTRPDPVDLLEEQASTRVPELVPIRYGRMLVSPFAFFRGGAAIMAADLAGTPDSGFRVQLCGDAHLSNFGIFGTPERKLVFDINDFDETLPGPWEWDVKRLAASLAVAARESGFAAEAAHRDRDGGDARLPDDDAGVRREVEPAGLVLTPRDRERDEAAAPRVRRPPARIRRGRHRQGPHERPHAGHVQTHPRHRGRARGSSATRR